MFKKSKFKIIMSITISMLFLLIGTLLVIQLTSRYEIYKSNREKLETYLELYKINGNPDKNQEEDYEKYGDFDKFGEKDREFDELDYETEEIDGDHAFKVSTFYSVAFFETGEVVVDNGKGDVYSDDDLESYAKEVLSDGKEYGNFENLVYIRSLENDYDLVVFMDNVVIDENTKMIMIYTFVFGFISVIVIFIVSIILANRIIRPLEENDEAQRQFISDAGHELKTPVSAISANLEMLNKDIKENKWATNIDLENQRMTVIVNQLLKLARAESLELKMEKIDFSRVVLEEVLAFEIIAFEENLKLNYEEIEDVNVFGNKDELRQVISIILDNAISHSNNESDINVTLTTKQNKILFTVENYCEPLTSEQLEKIFNRFYRSDYSRTGGENHYGLGLSIAKAIVLKHKGEIFATYDEGKICLNVILFTKLQ